MTTIQTINAKNESRGRKTGSKTLRVRRAVLRVLQDAEGTMTANSVARQCRQGKVAVGQALRWLEGQSLVVRTGSEKVTQGRGRASTTYTLSNKTGVNRTQQEYVRKQRAYQRKLAAMSSEERMTMVSNALKTLYALQTEDEQEERESMYRNGGGFTKADAMRGALDAEKEKLTLADVNYWLNNRRLYKYSKQVELV